VIKIYGDFFPLAAVLDTHSDTRHRTAEGRLLLQPAVATVASRFRECHPIQDLFYRAGPGRQARPSPPVRLLPGDGK
jgi:hypothetical protein